MRQQATYSRLLLTGAGGFLGGYAAEKLRKSGRLVTAGRGAGPPSASHLEGDLRDEALLKAIEELRPVAVVHLAGLTDADRCELDAPLARAVNEEIPARLAERVASSCRRFVYASTDLVFDGGNAPYGETAQPSPLSVYGRSKLAGERAVRQALGARASVVRLALLYGARRTVSARPSFAETLVERARAGEPVDLFTDQIRSPLHAEDAALAIQRLLEMDSPPELVHLGGPERVSRYELGLAALRTFGLPESLARPCLMSDRPSRAERPRDVSLDVALASRLGLAGLPLEAGLRAMMRDMGRSGS